MVRPKEAAAGAAIEDSNHAVPAPAENTLPSVEATPVIGELPNEEVPNEEVANGVTPNGDAPNESTPTTDTSNGETHSEEVSTSEAPGVGDEGLPTDLPDAIKNAAPPAKVGRKPGRAKLPKDPAKAEVRKRKNREAAQRSRQRKQDKMETLEVVLRNNEEMLRERDDEIKRLKKSLAEALDEKK
eukprot:m.1353372 g.1353372  ORF g.1353372 m.1353372 type:complete len:185 (-) comp24930_c1_seq26:5505-6059(-)